MNIGADLLDRLPNEVSGGELQRIALTRALAIAPSILLADEPTSRLDPITQRQTMMLIAVEAARNRIAVVLVTHDNAVASRWAQKAIAIA